MDAETSSSSSEESEVEEDEEGDGSGSRKRQRRELRQRREGLRKRVREYTTEGLPQAARCVAYDFASHLNKDDIGCLWRAIVSLTDHYVHQRTSHEDYMRTVIEYERRVAQSPRSPASQGDQHGANLGTKRIQYRRTATWSCCNTGASRMPCSTRPTSRPGLELGRSREGKRSS